MFGFYVEVQRLFLEELLVAMRTFMWVCAGMFLHVVVHRVLSAFDGAAMYTFIVSVGIFLVGEFVHLAVCGYINANSKKCFNFSQYECLKHTL